MEVRINKFLADHGIASRRAIDVLIVEKRIKVNGSILQKPGYMVSDDDRVVVDGKEIGRKLKKNVYILLNKPSDCVTTAKDSHGRKTVLDCVESEARVFPIGRLDKNTTGVLILTNDGDLANTLMHPRYSVEKVYRAYIDREFMDRDVQIFEAGISLDGKKTSPCSARFFQHDRRDVIVTLHEGKNRQIHRMFGALGYRVQKLERIRYAGLEVGVLKQGEWRYLTVKEVEFLKKRSNNK
ncbi:MAG: pseudouridine synthase [bacterium]|nr:pseudouridine synthase [bacterium]